MASTMRTLVAMSRRDDRMRMTPLVALAAGLVSLAAPAQGPYRCQFNGSTYLSDRPCPAANATRTQIGGYGPQRAMPVPISPTPSMRPAEGHVRYLGAECANLSEGMRTGPARGARGDVIQQLQQEYQRKCSVEDAEARKLAMADESRARAAQQEQFASAESRRSNSREQAERCANMRDTIGLRRKQEASMSEGELAGLRQFQARYNAQCLGR